MEKKKMGNKGEKGAKPEKGGKRKKADTSKFEEFTKDLPEGFRDTWERMPPDMKDYFVKAAGESRTSAEFVARIMVGSCPQCGSAATVDCDQVADIEDPTVGMCKDCGYVWCLECELPMSGGGECLHWDVCRNCDVPKNEVGDCEMAPSECDPMRRWLEKQKALLQELNCAFCGRRISEDCEHFTFGVKVLKNSFIQVKKGMTVEIALQVNKKEKKIMAIVPAEDSAAKKEGKDLLFVVCSEKCAEALANALRSAGNAFEITV